MISVVPPPLEAGTPHNWQHGPAVDPVTRELRYTSVSQIQKADASKEDEGCLRAWYYNKVVRCHKEPETEATKRGHECHEEAAGYLRTGIRHARAQVLRGIHLMPDPGPDLYVEQPLTPLGPGGAEDLSLSHLRVAGVPLVGAIDCMHERGTNKGASDVEDTRDPPGTVEVLDWKFPRKTEWSKKAHELPRTVQMVGYAEYVFTVAPMARFVRLSHGLMPVEGQAEKRTIRVDREQIRPTWEHMGAVVRSMADAAREIDPDKITANTKACMAFRRPCVHKQHCSAGSHNSLAALIGASGAARLFQIHRNLGATDAPSRPFLNLGATDAPSRPFLNQETQQMTTSYPYMGAPAGAAPPPGMGAPAAPPQNSVLGRVLAGAAAPPPVTSNTLASAGAPYPAWGPPLPGNTAGAPVIGHVVTTVMTPAQPAGGWSAGMPPGTTMTPAQAVVTVNPAQVAADAAAQRAAAMAQLQAEEAAAAAARQGAQLADVCGRISALGRGMPTFSGAAAAALAQLQGHQYQPGMTYPGTGSIAHVVVEDPAILPTMLAELQGLPPVAPPPAESQPSIVGPETPASQPSLATAGAEPEGALAGVSAEAAKKTRKKKADAPVAATATDQAPPVAIAPAGQVVIAVDCHVIGPTTSLEAQLDYTLGEICRQYSVQDIQGGPEDSPIGYSKWKGVLRGAAREIIAPSLTPGVHTIVTGGSEVTAAFVDGLRQAAVARGWLFVRGAS